MNVLVLPNKERGPLELEWKERVQFKIDCNREGEYKDVLDLLSEHFDIDIEERDLNDLKDSYTYVKKSWSDWLTILKTFVDREGHACVPTFHKEGRANLGTWVAAQRQHYRKNSLKKNRVDDLEKLPGWIWRT